MIVFAGGDFLSGGRDLKRSDLGHLNPFHREKQYSVNVEHQLKSKLA